MISTENTTCTKTNINEIECPHCHKAFKIDETGYADIVKQVRDKLFKEELHNQLAIAESEKQSAIALAEAKVKEKLQFELAEKNKQLVELKAKADNELLQKLSQKDKELTELKTKANNEITVMKAQIENAETAKQLAITTALQKVQKEKDTLLHTLQTKELEKQNLENTLKQQHLIEIKNKDEIIKYKEDEVARLKELKAKLSTKMIGETLEQHCETEFNKLRAVGFQNAYFGKDNQISDGTKGDYIYRETDNAGNELISIMFEMKNECDTTTTKKKNEDFFAKLDKDRKAKNCEYAILVSLLEADNEYYNTGIVDVSHHFEKMYVVRPQFFIPIISLLRNAASNTLEYKQKLNDALNKEIDITNFENKINTFREGFAKNYMSASNNFQKAIKEIDNSIAKMQAVKKALETTERQLRLANDKTADLTIKKLTYNNPTMKEKFNSLKDKK